MQIPVPRPVCFQPRYQNTGPIRAREPVPPGSSTFFTISPVLKHAPITIAAPATYTRTIPCIPTSVVTKRIRFPPSRGVGDYASRVCQYGQYTPPSEIFRGGRTSGDTVQTRVFIGYTRRQRIWGHCRSIIGWRIVSCFVTAWVRAVTASCIPGLSHTRRAGCAGTGQFSNRNTNSETPYILHRCILRGVDPESRHLEVTLSRASIRWATLQ